MAIASCARRLPLDKSDVCRSTSHDRGDSMNNARSLGFVAARSVLPVFILFHGTVHGALPPSRPATAPPLRHCKVTATSDLGLWDDVFVPHNQDFVVVRRGNELFSHAMAASSTPKKIGTVPAAEHTQIVAGAVVDSRCWLFLNSTRGAPCVLDAYSGTVVTLEVPGLKVPGSHTPGIQSSVVVPHANATIFAVSGGDRETWPRPGNHSVYFWMDLRTGKMARFPIGWDLNHFSADERVAVFAMPKNKQFERRPFQGIEMSTGERSDVLPDRGKESCVPYDWTDKQTVKPLYQQRQGNGDVDYFAGLSVGGLVLPVHLGLNDVRYLSMAKAGDDFAGFRLRRSGASKAQPSSLWIVPFNDPRKVEAIAADVTDFAMLDRGNAVYVTAGPGRNASSENLRHAEVFFYVRGDNSSWNVLDGLERLPELDKAIANADFITDRMTVHLIDGFGSSRHDPLVICLCDHDRGDLRALTLGQEPALQPVTWRRTLLITHDGGRCLTPLFREGNLPDEFWLHNSGNLLMGTYVWEEWEGGRKRQIRLSELTVQML
jgi:hypothetical protein